MALANLDPLREAIARNAAAVLSFPAEDGLHHYRSRFLGDATDDAATGGPAFWVESVAAERDAIDALVASGQPVGVTFKSAWDKIGLATPVWLRSATFQLAADVAVEALLMPYPQTIQSVQRRAHYRARVAVDSGLGVRAWRISLRTRLADRPIPSQEVRMTVRNLSLGGAGVSLAARDGKPAAGEGERLRIEISHGHSPAVLLDGIVRYVRAAKTPDGTLMAGLKFRGLEDDLEGRRSLAALTRIVGDLQREEVKRSREIAA